MKNKKGFTLIELLVVIAIIGLLSTLAVISLTTARSKARDARRTSDLRAMQSSIELYRTDNSDSLPLIAYLNSTTNTIQWTSQGAWNSTSMSAILSTYLSPLPTDPTNSASNYYQYCASSTGKYILSAMLENAPQANGASGAYNTYYNTSNCVSSGGNGTKAARTDTCASNNFFCLGQSS